MKNLFIIFMNLLFVLAVAADVIAVKYNCATEPAVQKSCYQAQQEKMSPVSQTADLLVNLEYKL